MEDVILSNKEIKNLKHKCKISFKNELVRLTRYTTWWMYANAWEPYVICCVIVLIFHSTFSFFRRQFCYFILFRNFISSVFLVIIVAFHFVHFTFGCLIFHPTTTNKVVLKEKRLKNIKNWITFSRFCC